MTKLYEDQWSPHVFFSSMFLLHFILTLIFPITTAPPHFLAVLSAWGVLVPWPGTEPGPRWWKQQVLTLNHQGIPFLTLFVYTFATSSFTNFSLFDVLGLYHIIITNSDKKIWKQLTFYLYSFIHGYLFWALTKRSEKLPVSQLGIQTPPASSVFAFAVL